ncbi:MAG: DUF4468 domain-containing protein [Bacteroidetes bacterium]|nr:DUF4468 domain-containing protein [Bacteroidota bacterium]MBL6964255.1 DUF4468 domain-containing protein [Bacteroidota bacterium]
MKRFSLFIILLSFTLMTLGQTIVSEIIVVDSTQKKSTLFSNGLTWFAYQFKSSNDVIQMKDLESGKIIGKGIFEYVDQNGKSIPRHILITLAVKDGKYKYDIELEIVREYTIVMKAKCLNCGKTTATVKYSDGHLRITDIATGRGSYHYDNQNVDWIERGNYKKWRAAVDAELPELRKKIEDEIKAQEKEQQEIDKQKINAFVESLKLEMVKVGDDF